MTQLYLICLIGVLTSIWAWDMSGLIISGLISLLLILYFTSLEKRISQLEDKLKEPSPMTSAPLEADKVKPAQQEHQLPKQVKLEPEFTAKLTPQPTSSHLQESTSLIEFIASSIKAYVFTGNPIAKIGVVILFIGVAFLLNYIHFSVEMRLLGVGCAGIAALITGWRLHVRRPVFSNILEGCGIGLLFLTTYAAFKLYEVLPPLPAFGILFAIVLLSGFLSIWLHSKSLAILGMLGGFLSPILISTGEGNYVLLFSYYAILNICILGIARFKAWSELNLLGFIFTFMLSALWGWQAYQPDYFYVTQAFLILFFLFYVAIAILYAASKPSNNSPYIDAVITFGTPFVTFALQASLVKNMDHGLAWSAFALCLFYGLAAAMINALRQPALRILAEAFFSLALIFGTVAIPLASSENWTVIAWSLEGLAILYLGIIEKRMRLRLAGGALQLASGILFLLHTTDNDWYSIKPYFDTFYLTAATVGLASLAYACLWNNYAEECAPFENDFAQLLFAWGALWWYGNGIYNVHQHVSHDNFAMGCTLFFASSSFAFWSLNEFLGWHWLRYTALALLPMMVIFEISIFGSNTAYNNDYMLTFAISFIILYGILYRHDINPASYLPVMHVSSLLLLTCVIADQTNQAIQTYTHWPDTWRYSVWGFVPAMLLFLITRTSAALVWPLSKNREAYQQTGGSLLSIAIICWIIVSCLLSGDISPLPYLPLLNPIDVTAAFSLSLSMAWCMKNHEALRKAISDLTSKEIVILFALLTFIWLNAVLLRTLHHWLDIPYTMMDLWHSILVQTAISIFWTCIALITTYVASRKHTRLLWFGGLALIAAVVIKLFFIDLSNTGTLQRIITFITVGILLLINGYVSPMPPKKDIK